MVIANPVDAERENWTRLVGRVVLSFGDMEFYLLQCLVHFPTQNLYQKFKDKDFVDKANKAIEVLNASGIKPASAKKLVSLINRAIKGVKKRNLIAHSPLHMAIYSRAIGDIGFRPEIRSLRSREQFVTLHDLEGLATESESLAGEFYEALNGALFNQ